MSSESDSKTPDEAPKPSVVQPKPLVTQSKQDEPINNGDPPNKINADTNGKKAVHVKWAGKTIALGTFGHEEAEEKCQRAKTLTRAWRSNMRPKPSREWVMLELERLGVRQVSGRLGRKSEKGDDNDATDDDDEDEKPSQVVKPSKKSRKMASSTGYNDAVHLDGSGSGNHKQGTNGDAASSQRNAAQNSMMSNYDPIKHDSYQNNSSGQDNSSSNDLSSSSKDIFSGLGLGISGLGSQSNNNGSNALSRFSHPATANQHYEMLKLHHMNLLNEIQETTLMMNLFQKQQLQQLVKQQNSSGSQLFDSLYNNSRPTLQEQLQQVQQQNLFGGLGDRSYNLPNLGPAGADSIQIQNLLRQQHQSMSSGLLSEPTPLQKEIEKLKEKEQKQAEEARNAKLEKLRKDILALQRQADDLEMPVNNGSSSNRIKRELSDENLPNKRSRDFENFSKI